MEYDPFLQTQSTDEKKETESTSDSSSTEASKKSKDQKTRDLFVERVQNFYSHPFSGELKSAGALTHSRSLVDDEDDDEGRAEFMRILRKEWKESGAGGAKGALKKPKPNDGLPVVRRRRRDDDDDTNDDNGKADDDLLQTITIETYVDFRVRTFAVRLENYAPTCARRLQLLESAVFLVNTAGGILAVLPGTLATWVAITVTISATLSALQEYHNLPRLVPALNTALRDVHNLLTWWSALSLIDRRTRTAKHHMVSTLEAASLSGAHAVLDSATRRTCLHAE